tara:strand:+ start:334 stop:1320 length:987 start_codon:yes stop_codon:yes gene_type:complete
MVDDFGDQDEVGEPGEHGFGGDNPGDPYGGNDPSSEPKAVDSSILLKGLANTAGSSLKAAPSNIGSQKSPSTKAGVDTFQPAANRGYDALRGTVYSQGVNTKGGWTGTSRMDAQQQLSNIAEQTAKDMAPASVGKQSPLGSGGKPYDTLEPKNKGFFDFTDYKQAGKDRDKYGEFYQAGFQANIPTHSGGLKDPKTGKEYPTSIPNVEKSMYGPGASRTGLDFDMAYSIANNPLGRWSSNPEKGMALAQMAMPFGIGTVVGGLRTLGYMYGTGKGQPADPTEDNSQPSPRTTPYKAPKVQTTTALNKPTLNVSRKNLRSAQGKITRRV